MKDVLFVSVGGELVIIDAFCFCWFVAFVLPVASPGGGTTSLRMCSSCLRFVRSVVRSFVRSFVSWFFFFPS